MMWAKYRAFLPVVVMGSAFAASISAVHCGGSTDTGPSPDDASVDAATSCHVDHDCALPASYCASPSELAYYTDGKCVSGQCRFTRLSIGCPCTGSGCSYTTTSGGSMTIGDMSTGGAGTGGQDSAIDATSGTTDQLGVDASSHPTVAPPQGGPCRADAADEAATTADVCELPPSVCADARWLAFFREPSCAPSGQCTWTTAYRDCGDLGCQHGGCMLNITR